MDFRKAAERYAALGSPQQVADRIRAFHAAGVRHVTLDLVGPYEERNRQIERSRATCSRCWRTFAKGRTQTATRLVMPGLVPGIQRSTDAGAGG